MGMYNSVIKSFFLFSKIGKVTDLKNRTMIPIYLDQLPSGTSTRPFVHYAQLTLLHREFKKYDFGSPEENIEHYGVPVPPNHNLKNVQVPTTHS